MTFEHLNERLDAMRSAILNTSLSNRLVDLPRNSASRLIRFNGSAQAIRDALASGQSLEIGKDLLQTVGSVETTRLKLKKMISTNAALQDQQGVSALQIGLGIIDWIDDMTNQRRSAPLLLWPIHVTTDGDQFTVDATDATGQINETLLTKIGLGREDLPTDPFDRRWKPTHPRIAQFEDQAVLDLFSQARWAMAERLNPQHNHNLLNHAILERLIFSDHTAANGRVPPSSRSSMPVQSVTSSPNLHVEPSDTSQDRAVTLTRAGCGELVVQGPPGTGKSQTIVNIIANAIEDNKTVLFMAEKMNAIEVVWDKLNASTYGKKNAKRMLMLQGHNLNRTKIAERFGATDNPKIIDVLAACPDCERPSAILTSPEAYALHVPDNWMFDLLIVDEASQMHLSSAVAAIAVSRQIVVCGDSQQMQPDTLTDLNGNEVEGYRLSVSLLTAAEEACFSATLLERHYRSRHPQLIDFSNAMFYRSRLKLTPSFSLPWQGYGVKYHAVEGIYNQQERTNRGEAQAVADRISIYLKAAAEDRRWPKQLSIGVIAMNEDQRDLIETYLCDSIREYSACLSTPLFIRTIDSVQGEERDQILISLTYGPDAEGKPPRNFGQISQIHGETRVNVMTTRARCTTEIFSSFNPDTMSLTQSKGDEALLFYLSAVRKGFRTLSGERVEGRLAKDFKEFNCVAEKFGQALCFKRRASAFEDYKTRERQTAYEDLPNLAVLYLTGLKNELDEQSEIAQYKFADWPVVEFPHCEFMEFCTDRFSFGYEKFAKLMNKLGCYR